MFEKAVEFTIEAETGGDKTGAYTNDPLDPGGETKWGISKRAHPTLDIAALTKDQAINIYYKEYWLPCRCGELPDNIAFLVFDTAVNQGTDIAIRLLQLALNVNSDGVIGPHTLMTAKVRLDTDFEFTVRRLIRYGNTKNFNIYGLGWVRRALKAYDSVRVL